MRNQRGLNDCIPYPPIHVEIFQSRTQVMMITPGVRKEKKKEKKENVRTDKCQPRSVVTD